MNRSILASSLASFVALGAHAAIADTGVPTTSNAAAAAPAAVTTSQATQATTTMTSPAIVASAMQAGRARRGARIPGTFALAGVDSSRDRDAQSQADSIRLMLPPLSGDGGG
jgi:hypothetical protein